MSFEERPVRTRMVKRIVAIGIAVAAVAGMAGLLPASAQTGPCETLLAVYNSGSAATRQAVLPYLVAFNCTIPDGPPPTTAPPTTVPPTTVPPTTAPPTTVPPTTVPPTTVPPTTVPPTVPPTTVSPSAARCQALQNLYLATTDPFVRGALAAQIQATPGCAIPG